MLFICFFFFFQAEDGIRDHCVTGVQTCALPISRVRSVQVHDEPRERAEAGQRVALNLAGVSRREVARGDVVVAATPRGGGPAAATFRVDVALSWATPDARPEGGARVAVHHGTRETAARLAELGGRYFQ